MKPLSNYHQSRGVTTTCIFIILINHYTLKKIEIMNKNKKMLEYNRRVNPNQILKIVSKCTGQQFQIPRCAT